MKPDLSPEEEKIIQARLSALALSDYEKRIEHERDEAQRYALSANFFELVSAPDLAQYYQDVVDLCDKKIEAMRRCRELVEELFPSSKSA